MKRLLLAFLIILIPSCAAAAQLAEIRESGIVVTLTDEPCAFKEHVTNLGVR